MFLGVNQNAGELYFLTNKKFANVDNPVIDPVEARISSPPLVKMINIAQIL